MSKEFEQGPWEFDPQKAVDLIFSNRKQQGFIFEQQIASYLLYIWALWPTVSQQYDNGVAWEDIRRVNSLRLKDAARCIGAIIAFSKIEEDSAGDYLITGEPVEESFDFADQVSTKWYQPFDRMFLKPLGGLATQVLEGENGKWHAKAINECWHNSILSRDVVRYISCTVKSYPRYATGKALTACLQHDIFGRGDYRQRKRAGKTVSASTVIDAWQKGLPTAVLLYAFERAFPRIFAVDMGKETFPMTLGLRLSRENCRKTLLYYTQLMVRLNPVMKDLPSLRRWHVLDVQSLASATIVAEVERRESFTDQELARFRAIHPGARARSDRTES